MATKRNVPYSSKKHKAERQKQVHGGVAVSDERNTSSTNGKHDESENPVLVTPQSPVKTKHVPPAPSSKKKTPTRRQKQTHKEPKSRLGMQVVVVVIAFIMVASMVIVPGL